jgi:hypothetical protein
MSIDTSAFGLSADSLGPPGFKAKSLVNSIRYATLDRRQQYYECSQHDFKKFDFDGRPVPQGPGPNVQPLLTVDPPAFFIPLKMRKPSNPYRMVRVIVNSFTDMIFGEGRWPTILVKGDENAQDYCQALSEAADLPSIFVDARGIGGSQGSVGISWRFTDGKPIVEVHQPKNIYVHVWKNRDLLEPAHVIECYRFTKDEWDPVKKAMVKNLYWFRRDWTTEADVLFKPVLYKEGSDPTWEVDEEETSEPHNDGECHFIWIQNQKSKEVDGVADVHGCWDQCDNLDIINSVLSRGTILNMDPTLVLKMDPLKVAKQGVSKGSDNALVTGEGGDATYLEISGASAEAGIKIFKLSRANNLETTQCVICDPDQVLAQGTSSVAQKMLYAPMLSVCNKIRTRYGRAIRTLLLQMLRSARKHLADQSVELSEDGTESRMVPWIDLPPRVEEVEQPVMDEFGQDMGTTEKVAIQITRDPGLGENIEISWGPYFPLTAEEQQQLVTTLTTANGGAKLISSESSVELAARAFSLDPTIEKSRIEKDNNEQVVNQSAMFGDQTGWTGGAVPDVDALPEGAQPVVPDLDDPSSLTQ